MSILSILGIIVLVVFLFNVTSDTTPKLLFVLIVGYIAFCLYRNEVGLPNLNPIEFLELLWNSIINIFRTQ